MMLPIKIQVNLPSVSGEKAKNRFLRWRQRKPSWISDRNNFSYFWSTSHPRCFLSSFKSSGLSVQEKKLKGFQMTAMVVSWNNFSYFWCTSHTNASYKVTNHLAFQFTRSKKKKKNRFSRLLWQQFWISDRKDFLYFRSTSHPDASYQASFNWPFGSWEDAKNRFSRWQPWLPS